MNRSRARSPEAIEFARSERATANEFAHTVWQWVRNRQVSNQKFRREVPIPPYTADFCSPDLKLILEIDGADHFSAAGQQRDRVRDDFLNAQGYRVVRIAGYEVLRDGAGVRERIWAEVKQRMVELGRPLTPSPSRGSQSPEPLTPSPSPRSGARGEKGKEEGEEEVKKES